MPLLKLDDDDLDIAALENAPGPGSRFYHGGPLGLTEILPPIVTGAQTSLRKLMEQFAGGDQDAINEIPSAALCHDPNRVSVTPDLHTARIYATGRIDSGYGAVYEVRPIGDVRPERYLNGSYSCDSAEVIRIHSILAEKDYWKYQRAHDRLWKPREIFWTDEIRGDYLTRISEEYLRMTGMAEVADEFRKAGIKVLVGDLLGA